jgi:RsiW-degrading membrane proteinase PrsW (M82 family)
VDRRTSRLRREVLLLVVGVLAVDAAFVAIYFLGQVRTGSDRSKLIFTALWTVVTLGVVILGLVRIRARRTNRSGRGPG